MSKLLDVLDKRSPLLAFDHYRTIFAIEQKDIKSLSIKEHFLADFRVGMRYESVFKMVRIGSYVVGQSSFILKLR